MLVRITLEKQFSEEQKSGKHTFEILIWLEKGKNNFSKTRARARGGKFFLGKTKIRAKRELFKLFRVRFKKQVSEVRERSEKLTLEVSI